MEIKILDAENDSYVEELYNDLIYKIKLYHPSDDVKLIEKAFLIAKSLHSDQKRKSGEPYVTHPISVAIILAELKLDKETIISGLLHDVVEDTTMTVEEIRQSFGSDIAFLVEGLTKLKSMPYKCEEEEVKAENYRKMFIAMAEDIRVVLIKLADRLHNMRTLEFQSFDKQIKISQETLDLYIPIAQRLGIYIIESELENLALKWLKASDYRILEKNLKEIIIQNKSFIELSTKSIEEKLKENNIEPNVNLQIKSMFSLFKKVYNKKQSLDNVYDFFYIKIIAKDVLSCYLILGILHNMYTPIINRFKDYISLPKMNRYQSIHTTLISQMGKLFEVQIRTSEMDSIAQYGITYNWRYKEDENGFINEKSEKEKINWLNNILNWQKEIHNNKDYLKILINDFNMLSKQIYCFTPTGEVKYFPEGATVIDFAYSIHSDIGNKMEGAVVNGYEVPINYKIQKGDCIKIITSKNGKGPQINWLDLITTSKSKYDINKYLKGKYRDNYIKRGKEAVENYCKERDINKELIFDDSIIRMYLDSISLNDWNIVLENIGYGAFKVSQVVNTIINMHNNHLKDTNINMQKLKFKISKCCYPVYGDEVICFRNKDNMAEIHKSDCNKLPKLIINEKIKRIDLKWDKDLAFMKNNDFLCKIVVSVYNYYGILSNIVNVISNFKINIESIHTVKQTKEKIEIKIVFVVKNKIEVQFLIDKINAINEVINVERI